MYNSNIITFMWRNQGKNMVCGGLTQKPDAKGGRHALGV